MARQRRRLHACGTGDERIRRCRIGRARFVVRSRWHPAFWTRNRGWSGRSCHRSRIRLDVVRAPAGPTPDEGRLGKAVRWHCRGHVVGDGCRLSLHNAVHVLRALSLDRCCGRCRESRLRRCHLRSPVARSRTPALDGTASSSGRERDAAVPRFNRPAKGAVSKNPLGGLVAPRSVSIDCSDHSQFSPVLTDWTKGGVEEMSLEQLVERLADATDRRSFLKRLSAATLGFTFGALGLAEVAHAAHCCQLCKPASSSCSGCACTWCWNCCDNNVSYWRCCECFNPGGCCCRGCYGAKCSYVTSLGGCPPQLLPEAA